MSTIEFSSAFAESFKNGCATQFATATYGYTKNGFWSTQGQSYSYSYLMKGTVPTNFSGMTATSARSTDILVTYAAADIHVSYSGVNPVEVYSDYIAAAASGTATWFWNRTQYGSSIKQQFVATVGIKGSGADVEIDAPTTDIVIGKLYKFLNLKINFPSSWTY